MKKVCGILFFVTILVYSNCLAQSNTVFGGGAGQSITTGDFNSLFGEFAGSSITTGSNNTAIGYLSASGYSSTGNYNTFVGSETGLYTNGSNNVFIGGKAGMFHTGSGNIFIGYMTGYISDVSDKLFIDNSYTASPLIYGDFSTDQLVFNGSVRGNQLGGALRVNSNWGYIDIGGQGPSYAHFITDRPSYHFNTGIYIDQGWVSSYDEDLILKTSGTSRLTILNSNGNVGIGTTSPRGILDADGPGDIYLVDDPNSGGTGQSIFIPGHIYISPFTNGSDWSYVQARRGNTSGTTHLRLRTTNSGSITEAMSILGNGYVGINATIPSYQLQVSNAYCDGNTWYNISDKNLKENFARISQGESILTKVMELPIQYWNYIGENTNRHIGPTAQDFYKIFGVGKNEKAISTVDESGIALAAIQELAYLVKEQQEIISTLLISKAAESEDNLVASETILRIHQNQPNPFQGDTKITMEIPYEVNLATLYVYDLHGKTIKKLVIAGRGSTSVTIEGGTLSSGIYLYTLIGDNRATEVKRMILTE